MTKKELIKDFKIFRNHCIAWRSDFNAFVYLFSSSPEHLSIMNQIAPVFFHDIQNMMIRDLYSRCSILMDPPKSLGVHINISIQHINHQLEGLGLLNGQIKRLTKSLLAYGKIVQKPRNKLISHLDQKTARRGRGLGKHKNEKRRAFLNNIQKYCDLVGIQIGIGPLDFSVSPCKGDVQDLLRALSRCLHV